MVLTISYRNWNRMTIAPIRFPSVIVSPLGEALLFVSITSLEWSPRFWIYWLSLLHLVEIPETMLWPHAVSYISLKQACHADLQSVQRIVGHHVCGYRGSPETHEGISFVLLQTPCIFPLNNNWSIHLSSFLKCMVPPLPWLLMQGKSHTLQQYTIRSHQTWFICDTKVKLNLTYP